MLRCNTWRVACVGIFVVLAVNAYSVLPYLVDAVAPVAPAAPAARADSAARAGAELQHVPSTGDLPEPMRLNPAAGSDGAADAAATSAASTPNPAAPSAGASGPAPASAACPASRKPYHTILTATGQVYQQWQCRIMYRHWLKQRALDPAGACTEMTGFTRLVASEGARPDGVEDEVPSVFVKEYSNAELSRFHGYRVINRPYSVVQLLASEEWRTKIPEEYVLIAETDHIFMHAIPNTARLGAPSAYIFNYMGPNPAFEQLVHRVWKVASGEQSTPADYKKVQPIGPSPVIIHKRDLERVTPVWHEKAIALKTDQEAESKLGWVIEMWGYAIAAASIGLEHQLFADFQVEPGALSSKQQLERFLERYWILHYTYQFEYYLDGTPCRPWTIGEYSLDKRHFSGEYPPSPLPLPPANGNLAGHWLVSAFNEAMANISTWPTAGGGGQPKNVRIAGQTVYGRRRASWFGKHDNGFKTEKKIMPYIAALIGSKWDCAESTESKFELELGDDGDATSGHKLIKRARWASMNNPELESWCPIKACIYVDSAGQFNVAVGDGSLTARRVGAGASEPPAWTCRRASP